MCVPKMRYANWAKEKNWIKNMIVKAPRSGKL